MLLLVTCRGRVVVHRWKSREGEHTDTKRDENLKQKMKGEAKL